MTQQHLQIASAVIGFIGTLIMFCNGYNLKPYSGATFGGPLTDEINKKTRRENKRIAIMQKLGMALLAISFFLQMVSFFDH